MPWQPCYNTENASLTLGPRVPDEVYSLGAAIAVGEKLYIYIYAVTTDRALDCSPMHHAMQVLSWARSTSVELEPWRPSMDWSWNSLSTPWPLHGIMLVSYALHPDGHTTLHVQLVPGATQLRHCQNAGCSKRSCKDKEEVEPNHLRLKPTLTCLGDSRFCLVENILCGEDFRDGSVIRVTLFGLKYMIIKES